MRKFIILSGMMLCFLIDTDFTYLHAQAVDANIGWYSGTSLNVISSITRVTIDKKQVFEFGIFNRRFLKGKNKSRWGISMEINKVYSIPQNTTPEEIERFRREYLMWSLFLKYQRKLSNTDMFIPIIDIATGPSALSHGYVDPLSATNEPSYLSWKWSFRAGIVFLIPIFRDFAIETRAHYNLLLFHERDIHPFTSGLLLSAGLSLEPKGNRNK